MRGEVKLAIEFWGWNPFPLSIYPCRAGEVDIIEVSLRITLLYYKIPLFNNYIGDWISNGKII
jgi:hypothetical protein